VYITFNTEEQQRKFLGDFSQGMVATMLDISFDLPVEKWFLKQKVLAIEQAMEPEALFYENIGLATAERQSIQQVVMLFCLFVFMYGEYEVQYSIPTTVQYTHYSTVYPLQYSIPSTVQYSIPTTSVPSHYALPFLTRYASLHCSSCT
jgi:hypothetical protein